MGAPIRDFVVSSNTNDIVTRLINDNDMTTRPVVPTVSPSMDIQVPSNFERLLFEMNRRDGAMTGEQLDRFRATGRLCIERDQRAEFIEGSFRAAAFDDATTLSEITRLRDETGLLVDPHTATATAAAALAAGPSGPDWPLISLATAHPAKFPDAVERATGHRPELPDHLADLYERPERTVRSAPDLAAVQRLVDSFTET
jgi:threonine synthase